VKARFFSCLGFAALVFSCAELFEEPVQCMTDADCERFGGVCDLGNGVCITRTGEDGGAPPRDPMPERDAAERPSDDRCGASPKPTSLIGTPIGDNKSEIATSTTLGCDKDWVLDGAVFVRSGATLTIEAGTTIKAKKGTSAAIIVSIGGRIVAQGESTLPIVITSDAPAPVPGDWRGVFILGRASPAGEAPVDGDPDLVWGGTKDDDDSGVLSFVRIEYANRELVLAGVGNKTKLDSVQVRRTVDNCFLFHGGTVDAKHLVCQSSGDDQFEWDFAYTGRAQFLFGQRAAPPPTFNSGGILVDDATPTIYNATICGDKPTQLLGYGVVFRDNATLDLNGAIVSGWFAGLDASGSLPNPGGVKGSIFFGNATNPAFDEDDPNDPNSPKFDDDFGFDENAAIAAGTPANATTDPKLVDCFDAKAPKPWPATTLTTNAKAPPNDGFFDANAKYIGAFKDEADPWMKGAWVRFDDK
jgi:hypothetical protein